MNLQARKNLQLLVKQVSENRDDLQSLDTSLVYEELRRAYTSSGRAVEVNFRELVGWLRVGDQLTHQIHPYPGKLLPHIAHFFVNASSLHHENRVILDPFCGSGTVALEASMAGFASFVADANPLALLITKVKTFPYDVNELTETARRIFSRARRFKNAEHTPVVNEEMWYLQKHKKSLEIILRAIQEVEDDDLRDFFRVCFSVTARRISFADQAVSVPVRIKVKPGLSAAANGKIEARLQWLNSVVALEEFKKTVEANIARVKQTNALFPSRKQAKEVGNDAASLIQKDKKLSLKENSIPLVLTSPPYGSAQKYIRASSLALNWLGMAAPHELSSLEAKSIGREHMPQHREAEKHEEALPIKYEKLIKKISDVNILRGKITQKYLLEMRSVVDNLTKVVSKNGHVVFVIGNNQVSGVPLRNDEYIISCFENNGMTLELSLVDHIKSRGLMVKRNTTASVISRESVLVFKR